MDREKDGVRWFLGKWLEVELADGRIITGQLACTDKDPNIVLSKYVSQNSGFLSLARLSENHVFGCCCAICAGKCNVYFIEQKNGGSVQNRLAISD